MNPLTSLKIVKNWQTLCHDIVFPDIAPSLIQERVISIDEYQQLKAESLPAQIQHFLMLLLKKDDQCMKKFVDILETNYGWLARLLQEESKSGTDSLIKIKTEPNKVQNDRGIENRKDEEIFKKAESHMEVDGHRRVDNNEGFNNKMENHTVVANQRIMGNGIPNQNNDGSVDVCDSCIGVDIVDQNLLVNNAVHDKGIGLKKGKIFRAKIRNRFKPKFNVNSIMSSANSILSSENSIMSPPAKLIKPTSNEEVTDEAITVIRRCHLVSKSWTTIAHSLGLTDRVNEIRYKTILHGEDLSMCIVYLLKDWIERFPKGATLSKLIEILRCEGYNNAADKLTEIQYGKKINTPTAVH